jgi:ATP-binding cassette subfamily B protein
MKYTLNATEKSASKPSVLKSLKRLVPVLQGEKRRIIVALCAVLVTSSATLVAPALIGRVIDGPIMRHDIRTVFVFALILLGLYVVSLCSSYVQTKTMGTVGRYVLFNLRNALFKKLQELPLDFFNQNKAGDLISRINNDTDQLNQFFAQALVQLMGNFFLIIGAGIFLIALNVRLGLAALVPALFVFGITTTISRIVKARNLKNLQAVGALSGEIQESLANFKVIVGFNRLDYFREKFEEASGKAYTAALSAGFANNLFSPLYALSTNVGQVIVVCLGIYFITTGSLTIGLLISFLLYVNNFYFPLRQMAAFWSSLQQALAGLERIGEVLSLNSDLAVVPAVTTAFDPEKIITFNNVSFRYEGGQDIIKQANFVLEKGKTYALVGPTGGGKTTTASLMARLYDPTIGEVLLCGQDIRSYEPSVRAKKIGFIAQEPFLFTGTVGENIVYGNEALVGCTPEQLSERITRAGLGELLTRVDGGLTASVTATGDSMSLGQKQLIAFMRVVLREPELLILDEATANIDTVTEQILEHILAQLPAKTTKVIIAHRLNTIASADVIFFVNAGVVTRAGSLDQAVDMLMHTKRKS